MEAQVRISSIKIPPTHRAVGDISALQRSIAELGLLFPIIVNREHVLRAGARRLAACKALGWTTVPAKVVTLDSLRQELVTLEENLTQAPLSELARALQLARQKEIYEALYPPRKGGPGRGKKQRQGVVPFSEKAARALGTSRRTVERDIEIGQKLDPKAAELLRDHPMDRGELRQLIRYAPQDQRRMAKALKQGKARSVKGAIRNARWETASKASSADANYQVRHGDFTATLASITPGTVDLVVTDPLWGRGFKRYHELTQGIAKALRPGGVACIMIGQDWLPDLLDAVRAHLTYRWTLSLLRPHRMQTHWPARMMSGWTPIVLATRGKHDLPGFEGDIIRGGTDRDTRAMWEKDEEVFGALVDRFSMPGNLVVDPFCGSGASGLAALRRARRYLGGDLDPTAVSHTATRLAAAKWADPQCKPKPGAGGLLDRWVETR